LNTLILAFTFSEIYVLYLLEMTNIIFYFTIIISICWLKTISKKVPAHALPFVPMF